MADKRVTVTVVCSECGGSGLYGGFNEQDGCRVICTNCDGTGGVEIAYTPFVARKVITGVTRVFGDSCGYASFPKDHTFEKEGITVHYSRGGCTYQEWLAGVKPKPVTEMYCPYLWTRQQLKGGKFYKSHCGAEDYFTFISKCTRFKNKAKCWEDYFKLGLE
jgi:hypothetical protein